MFLPGTIEIMVGLMGLQTLTHAIMMQRRS